MTEAGHRSYRHGGSAPRDSGPTPRSWLFVPGAAQRYVAKLADVGPDAAILDLEDGIAVREVAEARGRVAAVLASNPERTFLPTVVAVRSHPVSSAEFAADVASLGPRLTVLMLPKVASAAEVAAAAEALVGAGLAHAGIVAMIESAAGLENVAAILGAHSSLVGVAFGAEDFAADIGLPPAVAGQSGAGQSGAGQSRAGAEARAASESGRLAVLDAVRTRLVTAAAAAGVPWRIDTPVLQIRPVSLVETEARRSRSLGFGGKFVIHPSHVASVHAGYAPSEAEVAWARAVLGGTSGGGAADAHGVGDDRASGATSNGGQMIDEAVARQARAVLRSAGDVQDLVGTEKD
ncbi:MAG TPA: CoA ester lyase [Trueperaceae bacterium]|nr:CoA ester lyase [Trueperaceae bacterium]